MVGRLLAGGLLTGWLTVELVGLLPGQLADCEVARLVAWLAGRVLLAGSLASRGQAAALLAAALYLHS